MVSQSSLGSGEPPPSPKKICQSAHLDVIQRRIDDFIVVRQTVKPQGLEIQKDPMVYVHGMGEGMGVLSSTLEVFPADQTGVCVHMRQTDRTKFLEVKIKEIPSK